MICCLTSISPTHLNNDIQLKAVNSWLELGMQVYSINSHAECRLLKPNYPGVTFVETYATMQSTYGKQYVSLNALFDFAKRHKEDHFCIINSDIELKTDAETIGRIAEQMDKSIVLCNRVNYDAEYKGHRYLDGIDVFFIHKQFLGIFPQSMYCLGQCHFDYHIPYTALKSGVEVVFLEQDIAYHKNHTVQYNHDTWLKTGRYFLWENGLYQFSSTTGIGMMSQYVFNFIYGQIKRISI